MTNRVPYPTEELWAGFIDANSQDYDWSSEDYEGNYRERRWRFVDADSVEISVSTFNEQRLECEDCGVVLRINDLGELAHVDDEAMDAEDRDDDHDPVIEFDENDHVKFVSCDEDYVYLIVAGERPELWGQDIYMDGPMMNYRYPVNIDRCRDEYDAAFQLEHLPLCLVYDEDIDEWFLALTGGGMDLSWEICEAYMMLGYLPPTHFTPPQMCKRPTDTNLAIVEAYKRSCEIQIGWSQRNIERANEAITHPLVEDRDD